ncbi:MAG TPA: hypothetical protein VHE35_19000 [Kofleriaceae bacterium]|nr:hypothetical protein [Kofleriaceae bacterium]
MRTTTTILTGIAAALALAVTTTAARANDPAQAEKLFTEGKALLAAGKLAEACDRFDASQKMDPSPSTLMNLGDCREKNQQLASAWIAYVTVERQVRGDGRYGAMADIAGARAAAILPRLSYLTINVPDGVRVDGLVVTRDDVEVESGAWNQALPIDGGKHVIAGRAPGHETWSTTVVARPENDKVAVEVPRFKALRDPVGKGKTIIIDRSRPSAFTGRRKLALGVAGAGVAGLVAGGVMGLRAQSLDDDATQTCPTDLGSDCTVAEAARANGLRGDARHMALGANLALGLGAAAVVTGAVLWFTGGPHATKEQPHALALTPSVGGGFVGMSAAGRF